MYIWKERAGIDVSPELTDIQTPARSSRRLASKAWWQPILHSVLDVRAWLDSRVQTTLVGEYPRSCHFFAPRFGFEDSQPVRLCCIGCSDSVASRVIAACLLKQWFMRKTPVMPSVTGSTDFPGVIILSRLLCARPLPCDDFWVLSRSRFSSCS